MPLLSSKSPKIPGLKSRQLAERLRQVESRNITYVSPQFPIFWEKGLGSSVWDSDGNQFLDLTSAFGVAGLGHGAPAIRRAIQKQSALLWHGMGDVHPSAIKVEFLEALADFVPDPLGPAILSSSGAEAVESALKTAKLVTGKAGVIAFDGAYHGLSLGTLGVTHRPDFRKPFFDQISVSAKHFPFPDALHGIRWENVLARIEAFLQAGRTADGRPIGAILVEPIQGRGGIRAPDVGFLQGLRRLSKEHGVLLIFDEIFSGFCRTGKRFAFEHSGVIPDLLCLGKALASGFPLSACVGSTEIFKAWPESNGEAIHTSTFLGNPLGCAMGLTSINEFKKNKLEVRAASLGKQWKKMLTDALEAVPQVAEIRGEGLMIGIELVKDRSTLEPNPELAAEVMLACLKEKLLVLSAGNARNVISLTPPLVIQENELKRSATILRSVLRKATR